MNNKMQENDGTARILVVDDSPLMRFTVEELLVESGFAVVTAVDGLDAWVKIQKETVHAIVSDLHMPRLDGPDLTSKVRNHKRLRDLPIILISATDTNGDRRRGLQSGANAFLLKERKQLELLPATITDLLSNYL